MKGKEERKKEGNQPEETEWVKNSGTNRRESRNDRKLRGVGVER